MSMNANQKSLLVLKLKLDVLDSQPTKTPEQYKARVKQVVNLGE